MAKQPEVVEMLDDIQHGHGRLSGKAREELRHWRDSVRNSVHPMSEEQRALASRIDAVLKKKKAGRPRSQSYLARQESYRSHWSTFSRPEAHDAGVHVPFRADGLPAASGAANEQWKSVAWGVAGVGAYAAFLWYMMSNSHLVYPLF